MALPATDSFGSDAGTWTDLPGTSVFNATYQISGGTIHAASGADFMAYWNADTFGNDQYSQAVVGGTGASSYHYVSARCSSSAETCYYLRCYGKTTLGLRKMVSGTITVIGSAASVSYANGDTVKLEVSGSTLTGYLNGASQVTTSDTAIASGSAGLGGLGTLATLDNWEGGNLDAATGNPYYAFAQMQ